MNRINNRVEEMISKGLLKEVESPKVYRHKNSLQTVGYKELFDYFDGVTTLTDTIDKIKTKNTRSVCSRQITWFKKDKSTTYFLPENINRIIDFIG